jgi:nucleoside-diphosphate-sugar epimerase
LTGATGFVGGALTRHLRARGHDVVAIVRDPSKAAALREMGVDVRAGDVTNSGSMRAPMTGVDGVFHVAGWYKVGARDKRPGQAINVEGTRNVLELIRELGIPRGIYTSTLAVFSDTEGRLVAETYRYDGPHLTEYDRTKWVAHYQVAAPMMAAGLPLIIVQPGLIYGPGDTSALRPMLIQYLRRRLPMAPERTAFCWAHVDDVARGHALAMEKGQPGQSYIIAGPAHTLIDALAMAEEITGIRAPRLHASPGLLRAMARLMSVVETVMPLPEAYTAEGLRTIAGVTYLGDNTKARRELGYDPRPLRDGLTETLEHEMRLLGMRRAA